jgi:hypothetical protein
MWQLELCVFLDGYIYQCKPQPLAERLITSNIFDVFTLKILIGACWDFPLELLWAGSWQIIPSAHLSYRMYAEGYVSSIGWNDTCVSLSYWLWSSATSDILWQIIWTFFLTNSCIFMLPVMTMESQAEALGQLGADDLEGKVKSDTAYILLMIYLSLGRSDRYYLFVGSLQCSRLHRLMTTLHNWEKNFLGALWYVPFWD